MRIRAMIAALAVACSLALCAVPAFADSVVLSESEYGTITVEFQNAESPSFSVGMYRTDDGITLICLPQDVSIGSNESHLYWEVREGNSWVPSEVPMTSSSFTAHAIGRYRACYRLIADGQGCYVIFNITDMGEVGNDTVGIFGMTTQAIDSAVEWMDSFLDGILAQPVLLFFCIALGLLTIGITIIKRLLAVRA